MPSGAITNEVLAEAEGIVRHDPDSPEAARARYLLIRHAFDQDRYADMDEQIAQLEQSPAAGPWLPPAIYLKLLVTRKTEGALRLLQRIEGALVRFPDDAIFQEETQSLIPPALEACSQSDLETFLAVSPDGPLAPDALLTLGVMLRQQGTVDEANRTLRKLIAQHPSSSAALKAYPLLLELSRQIPTNPRVIGALLPVSGKHAAYGKSVTHGIELAVEEFETSREHFEFVIMDTGKDSEQALQSMDVLLKEKQVIALFGPLFSATALVCAAEANTVGVVMLTPSALDTKLTQTGPYVFRATLTLEQQAKSMAEFGVQTRGLGRFGILAPDSAYGRSLSEAFGAEVTALGGTVIVESRYPPDTNDFSQAIVEVGGADIVAYKEEEEKSRRAAQTELEVFLQKFFQTIKARPRPASSGTAESESLHASLPSISRVACLTLTAEPFTNELSRRLRAAAMPHKTIKVLKPKSATGFSAYLTHADIQSTGQLSSAEELSLAELLSQQTEAKDAPLTVLISVTPSSITEQEEFLQCTLAMYDSRTAHQLTMHGFITRRPLPPQSNRYKLEALYIPTTGKKLMHIVPQLVYHDLDLPLLGSDIWNDKALRKKPEAINLKAFFTVSFWPELDRHTRKFTRRYQKHYAARPDSLAANAYDAARLLMEAILRSDGTREGLRQTLAEFGEFKGVTGLLTMTPQRETEQEAVVLKINNGTITPVK